MLVSKKIDSDRSTLQSTPNNKEQISAEFVSKERIVQCTTCLLRSQTLTITQCTSYEQHANVEIHIEHSSFGGITWLVNYSHTHTSPSTNAFITKWQRKSFAFSLTQIASRTKRKRETSDSEAEQTSCIIRSQVMW